MSTAVVGALLIIAGCAARADDVTRPVRATLLLAGAALVVLGLLTSLIAATLE